MADFTQYAKPATQPQPNGASGTARIDSKVDDFIATNWQDLKSAYWIKNSWIWESLLMYAGNLWLRWENSRRGYVVDTPEDDFTPRPRVNRFANVIDAVASVFQTIPEVEAVPVPKDDYDRIGIAEVCNRLSDHFIKDCALRSDYGTDRDKVTMAGQWFTLGGGVLTNVYSEEVPVGQQPVMAPEPAVGMQCTQCDTYGTVTPEEAQASGGTCPKCGNPMSMTDTQVMNQQMDETGAPMMEPITEKRVRCDLEEPLWFYPKAGAKSMKTSGFTILANRMNLDRIWSELGIDDATPDAEYPDGWNTTAENALNFFYLGYSNMMLTAKDAAMVLRVYVEPKKIKDFPEGFYAIYINGTCKHLEQPWPFGDEHPLSKGDFKAMPTMIFGRSVAFDLAGAMREFLDYSSIIKLHALTTAVDPWVVDDSTNTSEITGRGDKIISYTSRGPGSKEPHHSGAGHLDNGVYEMRKLSLEDLDAIAMTVAVWRGEQPTNADSGKAIDSLRVQASAMFAGPARSFANLWRETIRKGVKLYQKDYTVEQLTQIVGDDHLTEIEAFKKCKLDDCIEWIATEQGMPRTKDERRRELVDLFDRGMLDVNDPAVRETAFELFGETGMLGTFNKDATRARWENSSIKHGQGPVFMPEIDDNMVHLQIHGDQIKSMDFLNWDQPAKEAMMQHYMETKAAAAAMQAPPPPPLPGKNPMIRPQPPAPAGPQPAALPQPSEVQVP
jgi:hypothetical protein